MCARLEMIAVGRLLGTSPLNPQNIHTRSPHQSTQNVLASLSTPWAGSPQLHLARYAVPPHSSHPLASQQLHIYY
eukprot:c24266_g3_i1 orf=212-436(+)